jgi:tRNA U34 5-carboxymethylaminomethyl modifying enzyme MnmG/GidA
MVVQKSQQIVFLEAESAASRVWSLVGGRAGINAARRAQQLTPIVMPRNSSYLGTLVDDLVTKVSNQAGNLCLQI